VKPIRFYENPILHDRGRNGVLRRYCGREGSEHNIEPMVPVRGWAKAHLCTNPDSIHTLKSEEGRHRDHTNLDLTCGQRSEDGKWTNTLSEEPEE